MYFRKNETFTIGDDETFVVEDLLGEGGQGEVYLVRNDAQGERYALKIYKNKASQDFKYNLKNNIEKGCPSEDFLWPKRLFERTDGKIGYLMNLRPKNYVSFVSYLTGKHPFKNKATLIKWCVSLCSAFKKLHENGYSYQDLNDGSFFMDTEPKDIGNFKWKDLSTDGGTNLSKAYDALAKWLCKKEKGGQMPDLGGIAPIIILMTDGLPTCCDWEKHLDELKKKGWYRVALKYALAIGIDTDEAMNVLCKFTGNPETVLKVYTAEALRKVIKVIAVTASKVKSSSSSANGGGVAGAVADNNKLAQDIIAEKLEEVNDIEW